MAHIKDQTIGEYANISEIPLIKVLEILENAGYSCKADDVLNHEMRKKLAAYYRKALPHNKEELLKQIKKAAITISKIEEEIDKLDQKISEAIGKINIQVEAKHHLWSRFKQILNNKNGNYESSIDELKQQKATKLNRKIKVINNSNKLKRQLTEIEEALQLEEQQKTELKRQREAELRLEKQQKAKLKQQEAKLKRQEEAKIRLEQKQKEADKIQMLVKKTEVEARKIGQLIELCCNLIPVTVSEKIITDCQKQHNNFKPSSSSHSLSDIFLDDLYDEINKYVAKEFNNVDFDKIKVSFNNSRIVIPKWVEDDYDILSTETHAFTKKLIYIDNIERQIDKINNFKKNNCYTSALISTIYFLLTDDDIKEIIILSKSLFERPYAACIGELIIATGDIVSALELYNIDERVYSAPNKLSLLAKKAIEAGRLDDSVKLINKLIEKEPYHPAVPELQAEIKRLDQRSRLKSLYSIDISLIDQLSGLEFENLLLDKFSELGFKVETTAKTGDFGADLIIENKEGTRVIVQCKRFKSKVNLKAVQEVVGAIGHYYGDLGIVITNNSFLSSAVKLAESHDIELWDGSNLVSFLAGDVSFSRIMNDNK